MNFRRPTRGKWLCGLSLAQVVTAIAAAVAMFVEVESILGFGPALALIGLILARGGVRLSSLNLLLFGLWCPMVTAILALLIAAFNWSPHAAETPARIIMTLNAFVTTAWGAWTVTALLGIRSSRLSSTSPEFSFSLLGLFGLLTVASVVFAVVRLIEDEMNFFTAYGLGILALSAFAALWFVHQSE